MILVILFLIIYQMNIQKLNINNIIPIQTSILEEEAKKYFGSEEPLDYQ